MTAEERDTYRSSASRLYQKSDDTAATIVAADSIDGKNFEQNTAMKFGERAQSSPSSTTSHLAPIKTGEVLPPGEGDMKELEKQDTMLSIHHPRAFPDGGYHAWLCVVGAFFATLSSFGWINCVGVFQAYYQDNQLSEYSPSTVSWIASLEVFFMFVFGPLVGKIFDTHGPRWIIITGTFLQVFGLMMVSISTKYWHFLLTQGVLVGIGGGFIFNPSVACVMTWFYRRRAFAAGIVASGSSVGGLIFPIMVPRLIKSVGFGWAIRITAFFILALMTITNLTIKSRLPPKRNAAPKWHLNHFVKNFKEAPFNLTVLASFFFFFAMFIPLNYLTVFARHHGMSKDLANYLISILNGVSVIGRILPSYFADKIGRYNMVNIIAISCSILILALWLPATGNVPTIIFGALYGFAMGAFVSIGPSLMAQISDVREIGVRTGLLFSCIAFGALAGNPVAGSLVTRYKGEYIGLQIFAGVIMFVSFVIFVAARWSLVGKKLVAKV